MGALRKLGRDLSLRKSLVLYIAAFTVLALAGIAATGGLCEQGRAAIRGRYAGDGERYYLTSETGERLGDGVIVGTADPAALMTPADRRAMAALELLPGLLMPVWSGGCLLAAALLFYRNKLRRPLAELRLASEKISRNELDFSVQYDSGDELGVLCAGFEAMRQALAKNNRDMWRQMEERKRLNAAFAHDLRTPLTVLKGRCELLLMSDDPAVRATAETMSRHILRLERYAGSMSSLGRLEDAVPACRPTPLSTLLPALAESGNAVCTRTGKEFSFRDDTASVRLSLDPEFVSQACENLLSNAARYAGGAVGLRAWERDGGLALTVTDDGPGFSGQGLRSAAEPYFTEAADRGEHFGLGLYICRLLCERHGGALTVENGARGAKVTAYFRASP